MSKAKTKVEEPNVEDQIFRLHIMYSEQIDELKAQIRTLTRLYNRIENRHLEKTGKTIRLLKAAGDGGFREYGNMEAIDEHVIAAGEFLNGELDMSRDFKIMMDYVKSDETMTAIWQQLMTMMKLMEGVNVRD